MSNNPYSPPTTHQSQTGSGLRFGRSLLTPQVAVLLSCTIYFWITLALVLSSPSDRKAGLPLLFNTPFLVAWGYLVFAGKRHAIQIGSVAVVLSLLIGVFSIVAGARNPSAILALHTLVTSVLMVGLLCSSRWTRVKRGEASDAPKDRAARSDNGKSTAGLR